MDLKIYFNLSIQNDEDRERIFNDLIGQMQETCLHHIKKKKEKRKKSKRSRSSPASPPESEEATGDEDESSHVRDRSSKYKDKERESGEISSSKYDRRDDHDDRAENDKSSKKHKKSKRKKKQKSVCFFNIKNWFFYCIINSWHLCRRAQVQVMVR